MHAYRELNDQAFLGNSAHRKGTYHTKEYIRPQFSVKKLIRKLSFNLCTECNASLRVKFRCVNIGVQWHFSCLGACENVSMRLTNETGPRALLGKCRPK